MRITAASRTLAVLVPLAVALVLPVQAAAGTRAQENPDSAPAAGFRLPTVLEKPSPWVPLVTDDPVPAVSAVLPALVAHGPWNRDVGFGMVVLSADGTQYRRLPYRDDHLYWVGAISPDGHWVAQVNDSATSLNPRGLVVTLLRLGERSTRDVVLPDAGGFIRYLLFDRDGSRLFVVSGSAGGPDRAWFSVVDTTAGRAELVCRCPVRLGVDRSGAVRLHEGTPEAERLRLPLYGAGGDPAQNWLGRYPDAVADDGSWAELYEFDQIRVVGGGREIPRVLQPDEGSHAVPLRLENDRLLVAVGGDDVLFRADDFHLAWVDLASKQTRTVLTAPPAGGDAGPALAFDALTAPSQRPKAATEVPWWSGDRREYYLGAVPEKLQEHARRNGLVAATLLAAAGLLVVRRRRRRALR